MDFSFRVVIHGVKHVAARVLFLVGMVVLWTVSTKAKKFTLEGSCDGHGWTRSTSK